MRTLRTFAFGCFGLLILAEGILCLLPVSQGFYLDTITPEQPIARRLANRQATSSMGWNLSNAVSVPINAQGFIDADDFSADMHTPLTVLIGDSQIEAPLIPWEQSLSRGLERRLKGDMRVYPVGMSGAPLSQYLIWYQNMATVYKPETVVFFISSNDFIESFEAYGLFPGFHYFEENIDGSVSLKLRVYERGLISRIASSSSLVAYILNNLNGASFLTALQSTAKPIVAEQAHEQLAASAPSSTVISHDTIIDQDRQKKGLRAIDLFFERLPRNGQKKKNIVFAMNPDTQRDALSDVFRQSAKTYGYPILELSEAFDQAASARRQELVFSGDVHWNALGQAVVADAVASFLCASCKR